MFIVIEVECLECRNTAGDINHKIYGVFTDKAVADGFAKGVAPNLELGSSEIVVLEWDGVVIHA